MRRPKIRVVVSGSCFLFWFVLDCNHSGSAKGHVWCLSDHFFTCEEHLCLAALHPYEENDEVMQQRAELKILRAINQVTTGGMWEGVVWVEKTRKLVIIKVSKELSMKCILGIEKGQEWIEVTGSPHHAWGRGCLLNDTFWTFFGALSWPGAQSQCQDFCWGG